MTRFASWFALLTITGVALSGCGRGANAGTTITRGPLITAPDATPLHDAAKQVNDVIVYDIFSPPQASRVYAYASIAAYEILRQADTSYHTLAGQLNAFTPVPTRDTAGGTISLPLAGVHAYMVVGRALTFSQARMDTLRRAMDQRMRGDLPQDVFDRSIAYGDTVAQHVLAWAAKDRFTQRTGLGKFSVLREPGRWIPTPPAYMDAVEPSWGTLRAFSMDTSNQFRPEPPYPFDSTRRSLFFRDMKEVHDVTVRMTDEQRAIAAFWDCNPFVMHVQGHTMFATKKMSPGGHWQGIVRLASHKANADILRSAEAYALTSVALADAFLSVWAEKFRSNVIRPETVINKYLDERWTPLLQTPPFPEYTSGHSGISSAASVVLTRLFGNNFAFADSAEVEYGLPVRTYPSFDAAAKEAAISRLYGGIHYRHAIEQGQIQGAKVGQNLLAKVHTRAAVAVASAP